VDQHEISVSYEIIAGRRPSLVGHIRFDDDEERCRRRRCRAAAGHSVGTLLANAAGTAQPHGIAVSQPRFIRAGGIACAALSCQLMASGARRTDAS
jgi:hypothetical protein